MKILNYKVHNVLRISDLEIDMDGHHLVLIGGKNGHGKTSAIKALLMALCGRRDLGDSWPEVALRDGEDSGYVEVKVATEDCDEELHEPEGLTIELRLERDGSGVVVEEFCIKDSAGYKAPEPRTLLRKLYKFRGFDPLGFEKAKPKDQHAMLSELLGIDFTKENDRRQRLYAERTVVNSELKKNKTVLESLGEKPAVKPKISVDDLSSELSKAVEENKKVETLEARAAAMKQGIRRAKEEIARAESSIITYKENIDSINKELAGLTYQETDKILKEMKHASMHNAAVDEVQMLRADIERTQKAVDFLEEEAESYNKMIREIDNKKKKALAEAPWPLPGLSLADGEVMLNGLPFKQASKAQRVIASFKIGMAMNPKFKLLVCEDGNDLDMETMKALEELLYDSDYQALVEFVTRHPEDESMCKVVLQEGASKDDKIKVGT